MVILLMLMNTGTLLLIAMLMHLVKKQLVVLKHLVLVVTVLKPWALKIQ